MSLKKNLGTENTNVKGGEKMLKSKGQSTLEYVLVLTAIIAGIIFAASRFIQPRVQSSLDHVTQEMDDQVGRIRFGN